MRKAGPASTRPRGEEAHAAVAFREKRRPTPAPRHAVALALACAALGAAGCATPGPLHVYSFAGAPHDTIRDDENGRQVADVPSFVADGEHVLGFAYDPFTDHFFLRLAPGNHIRVVDRPARAIKREFDVPELPKTGGDLAVSPRTGHLFFVDSTERRVIETSRLGAFVRTFSLDVAPAERPEGIAYDMANDRLLVLVGSREQSDQLAIFDRQGHRLETITLDRPVARTLGFDARAREIYASTATPPAEIVVFDEHGKFLRELPGAGALLDVGERSFLRVF